ncbi:very short patch repair endonuclease [Bradyrhizobium sp. S69]|uniref:very short patch repair endonuclease n=1 Tax=Bradyrhizobium sp. S69 TaxID=1641856 RepID=UPI00131C39CC|nr:very short patch repair endonuclease [Bradyrhizobium sp. S69]
MDRLSPEARSRNMGRIRSRDTSPELAVRSYLHAKGLRFRLHRRDLPGKPDLVFAGRHAVLFVHGCFWHGCPRCVDGTRRVKSNVPYWSAKVEGNRARDKRNIAALRQMGWLVFTVWECEIKREPRLARLAERIIALHI